MGQNSEFDESARQWLAGNSDILGEIKPVAAELGIILAVDTLLVELTALQQELASLSPIPDKATSPEFDRALDLSERVSKVRARIWSLPDNGPEDYRNNLQKMRRLVSIFEEQLDELFASQTR